MERGGKSNNSKIRLPRIEVNSQTELIMIVSFFVVDGKWFSVMHLLNYTMVMSSKLVLTLREYA